MRMYTTSSRAKKKRFQRKIESQMLLFISGRHIGVHTSSYGVFIQSFYKGAWNVWANNSETVYHTDLRLIDVFFLCINLLYRFIFLATFIERFQIYFFYGVTVKTIY